MRALPAAALTLLAACAHTGAAPRQAEPPPAYRFTLIDQDGRRYTVGQNPQPATALYFGFTRCKDICPQTLARLSRAREAAGLSPNRLRIVMVTVDAAHDTPAAMKAFLARTGAQAFALTGPPRLLQPIYRAYGVAIQPQKSGDVAHTDYVYFIDTHARLQSVADPQTAVKDLAARMRSLLD